MFYFNLNRFDLIILDFGSSFEGILKKINQKGTNTKFFKVTLILIVLDLII